MKPTVTIGIPAFNEEANICNILSNILEQKEDGFTIGKIVVISDGSTDRTVELASSIRNSKIDVIDHSDRKGKAVRENEIIKQRGDSHVVIVDADTLINDTFFIKKLLTPIFQDQMVGLTAAKTTVLHPKTFTEKVLKYSVTMKESVYKKIKDGNNVYLCRGTARAFSSNFLKRFQWEGVRGGEDAYSYFSCIKSGYNFKYVSNAEIFYRLPQNIKDHFKQSSRFFSNRKNLEKLFGKKFVSDEFKIPFYVIFSTVIEYVLAKPFLSVCYICVVVTSKLYSLIQKDKAAWNHVGSSKYLITDK